MFKIKRNKKGITSIEMIISVMIFIIIFSFLIDMLMIMWKYSVVAQTNTEVARITGIQGGALTSAPAGYPGANSNYISIGELHNLVDKKMQSAGFKLEDWNMTVGNGKIGSGGIASSRHDYKETFTTELKANYEWKFMSNFIPGSLKQSLKSKRISISEWKYDYNNWIGE